eukprot:gene67646-biopygen49692
MLVPMRRNWKPTSRLNDEALVNGIAQIAPFDVAAKQALLEAGEIEERAELIIQLMQFFGRHDGDGQLRYDAARQELVSDAAGIAFPIRNGVPILRVDEARTIAP